MSKTIQTARQYWDERSELFANYYKTPTFFDKWLRKSVYLRTAIALKTIQEYPNCTILDIGSGPGVNSVMWLKNSDASFLLGIDFAGTMNEYAKKNAVAEGVADRCSFIEGDFMKYDFGDKRFDVSVAAGVFDYIEDADSFINKIAEVTDKAFVVSWPENGLRMFLRRWRYNCPVFYYTEKKISDLHLQSGIKNLEIIKVQGGWITIARR